MNNEASVVRLRQLLPICLHPYLTEKTEEIRFRRNREVMFLSAEGEITAPLISDEGWMEELLDRLTQSSLYTFSENITEGYLTLEGGHRVGICGTGVYQNGRLSDVRDISSLNLRIAHEVKGCAEKLFQTVYTGKEVPCTLIVSPPGYGKTTLLRDLLRLISDRKSSIKIAVVDQRSELSGTYRGNPANDLGKRTDILNGYTKPDGICRAVRTLAPTLIGVDEIGSPEDEESILFAHYAGVKVIATIHGNESGDFQKSIPRLIKEKVFDYYVYLTRTGTPQPLQIIRRMKESSC